MNPRGTLCTHTHTHTLIRKQTVLSHVDVIVLILHSEWKHDAPETPRANTPHTFVRGRPFGITAICSHASCWLFHSSIWNVFHTPHVSLECEKHTLSSESCAVCTCPWPNTQTWELLTKAVSQMYSMYLSFPEPYLLHGPLTPYQTSDMKLLKGSWLGQWSQHWSYQPTLFRWRQTYKRRKAEFSHAGFL